MKLDKYDREILTRLQKDGRIRNVELAQQVNLSESACLRRVRALEKAGLIKDYVALVDPAEAGLSGTCYVQIALKREEQRELDAFEDAVREIPEVMACHLMTGEFDYVLKLVFDDMADFERLHTKTLMTLPGVSRINSNVAIRTVFRKTAVPIR